VDFDEFTRTGLRPLLQFTRVLTGNRALAEDIVQEVLIRLHARSDRLDEVGQLGAYARRMAVNEYLGWRRKWFRQRPTAAPPEPAPAALPRAAAATVAAMARYGGSRGSGRRGRHHRHARRGGTSAGAGGTSATPGTSTRPAPRPTTLPPPLGQQLRFTATLGPVPGYNTTTDGVILARFERFTVLLAPNRMHGRPAGTVTVYHPGAYDARHVLHGQRVTLLGRPAYYTFTSEPLESVPGGPAIPAPPPKPTLAWQTSDGRWIVIRGWEDQLAKSLHLDPLNEERRTAAAVDTSASEPMRLPFRISYLPRGLTCVYAANSTTRPHLIGPPLWAELDLGCPGKPDIRIQFGAPWGNTYSRANLRVNGHPAVLSGGLRAYPADALQLMIDLGKKHFLTLGGEYPEAELVKIAKSITLAPDLDHPSKWFDATK
jgi:hypothetical protein